MLTNPQSSVITNLHLRLYSAQSGVIGAIVELASPQLYCTSTLNILCGSNTNINTATGGPTATDKTLHSTSIGHTVFNHQLYALWRYSIYYFSRNEPIVMLVLGREASVVSTEDYPLQVILTAGHRTKWRQPFTLPQSPSSRQQLFYSFPLS